MASDTRYADLFALSIFATEWDIATTNRIWRVLLENSIPWKDVLNIPKDVFIGTKGVGEKTWTKYKQGRKTLLEH